MAPQGLFFANDDGSLGQKSIDFKVEARPIDNNGAPTGGGAWTTLANEIFTAATNTPQRKTYRYTVTSARYEVQLTRTDTKDTSSRAGHTLNWAAMRAYIPGVRSYGDITLLAMRARATNNLAGRASRRINLIVNRKLPVWSTGSGWSAPQVTRSIAWAAADVIRAKYGAGWQDARIDLAQLETLDQTWAARGDTLNAIFDSRMTVDEALKQILQTGRTMHYQQGGIVRFTRDEAQTMPVALFSTRNMVAGSFRMNYIMPTSETADAVEVEYFDETLWKPQTVLAKLPNSAGLKPAKIHLLITDRKQAWNEGIYQAASNLYRRVHMTFQTELEGHIPSPGDLIAVQHDMAEWGQSGDVIAYDAGTLTLTVDQPPEWTAGQTHYAAMRRRDGSLAGPYQASQGATPAEIVLAQAPDFTPYTGQSEERTHFAFGVAQQVYREARVVPPIRTRGEHIQIAAVAENDSVHTADQGIAPSPSIWQLAKPADTGQVIGLNVQLTGTAGSPLFVASWQALPLAHYYMVEQSQDNGGTWTRLGEPRAAQFAFPAKPGVLHLRVAATSLTGVGPWTYYSGTPFLVPPPNVSTFQVEAASDGTRVFTFGIATPPTDLAGYRIRYRAGTGWTWAQMTPLHTGLVTVSPYETNLLEQGVYTFAIVAVDQSGLESEGPIYITGSLPNPRLAGGVVFQALPHGQNWPGTKTNCHVAEDGGLYADGTATWSTLPATWAGWTRWNFSPISPIVYEHTVIDLGGSLAFAPAISANLEGTPTYEYAISNDNISWGAWTLIDGQVITARYLKARITVAGAEPIIHTMDIRAVGPNVVEDIADLDPATLSATYRLGTGNYRLPIAKTYNVIRQVQISLQGVGPGWSWEIVDKQISPGPQVKIYDGANALADPPSLDALIRGS